MVSLYAILSKGELLWQLSALRWVGGVSSPCSLKRLWLPLNRFRPAIELMADPLSLTTFWLRGEITPKRWR